jgi:hypothetical protein
MNPLNDPKVLSLNVVDGWKELANAIQEASNPSNPTEDQRRIRKALDVIETTMRDPETSFSDLINAILTVEDILSGRLSA